MPSKKIPLALVGVLVATFAGLAVSTPQASAHRVTCDVDAYDPWFNTNPAPGRAVIQGIATIQCTPTAPDSQRTNDQIQYRNMSYGPQTWTDRGRSYLTYSNWRYHQVYDSTTCREMKMDTYRTKVVHSGTHVNTIVKTRYSPARSLVCRYNVP